MNAFKQAKDFIKFFSLKKGFSIENATAIAHKQGYTVRLFLPWNAEDIALFRKLNCEKKGAELHSFCYCLNSVKLIFVMQSLTEQERIIALIHESIHIFLGHISPNHEVSVAEEKQTTDVHAAIDFILSGKRSLHIAPALSVLAAIAVLAFAAGGITGYSLHNPPAVQTVNANVSDAEKPAPSAAVYITHSGTKYHRADCVYAKDKFCIALSKTEASKHYAPCAVCKP